MPHSTVYRHRLSVLATSRRCWVATLERMPVPAGCGGQIYDPYTTRQVNATCAVPNADPTKAIAVGQLVWIRDPIAGNNLANSVNGIDPSGRRWSTFTRSQSTINFRGTGLPQAWAVITPTNIAPALTTTSATAPDCTGGTRIRGNSKMFRRHISAPIIPPDRDKEPQ